LHASCHHSVAPMGNAVHGAVAIVGSSTCGPGSMCSGGVGTCRILGGEVRASRHQSTSSTDQTAGSTLQVGSQVGNGHTTVATGGNGACSRTPPPPRYEYPSAGHSTPRSPLDTSAGGQQLLTQPPGQQWQGGDSCHSARFMSEQQKEAQQLIRNFAMAIVKGIAVKLIPRAGQVEQCVVFLDRALRTLFVQRVGPQADMPRHGIPLQRVISIVVGDDSIDDECVTHISVGAAPCNDDVEDVLPATEMCVTLLIDSEEAPCVMREALNMEFPSFEERDTFALCLATFVEDPSEEPR